MHCLSVWNDGSDGKKFSFFFSGQKFPISSNPRVQLILAAVYGPYNSFRWRIFLFGSDIAFMKDSLELSVSIGLPTSRFAPNTSTMESEAILKPICRCVKKGFLSGEIERDLLGKQAGNTVSDRLKRCEPSRKGWILEILDTSVATWKTIPQHRDRLASLLQMCFSHPCGQLLHLYPSKQSEQITFLQSSQQK